MQRAANAEIARRLKQHPRIDEWCGSAYDTAMVAVEDWMRGALEAEWVSERALQAEGAAGDPRCSRGVEA
jgi:hypothetical protein